MRLYTRDGQRFRRPLSPDRGDCHGAAGTLLIDDQAIVSDAAGLALFELIRSWRHGADVVLCAFDLLELDGEDLHGLPIEARKRPLARLLAGRGPAWRSTTNAGTIGHRVDHPHRCVP